MDGFVRVAAAIPCVSLADSAQNTSAAEGLLARADGMGVEVVCFPN